MHLKHNIFLLLALLITLICITPQSHAKVHLPTVLGIDFGSEFIKIGFVSRGKPIDLVLNEQSKRKTSNFVGFRRVDERLFGENARQMSARFPASAARYYMQMFQGKKYENAKEFLNGRCRKELGINAYEWAENKSRGTVDIILWGEDNVKQVYQSEELMAYMLRYIVSLVDPKTQQVTGVVITIPPYFTTEQRQAVRDAAKLANVHLLGLMHETTAMAIQYGVSRYTKIRKEQPAEEKKKRAEHNVIFFDMGATATNVLIAQFTEPKKKGALDLGDIKILSIQWNVHVGGEDFTARLAEHLAKKFEEKHGVDLTKEDRVMERLRAFAKKAKEVLTANSETIVFMETIYNDIDFKVTITREEFEEMCSDLIETTLEPVRAALAESKLKMKNVDALEVVGGGARVIAVQDKLNSFFRKGISHSLNGDESIALGAALYAATLSPMFRVRSFNVNDAYPFGIEFVLSGTDADTPEKTYALFKKNDNMGVKRFVNVPRTEDFHITLKYTEDSVPRDFAKDGRIAQFHFKNVKESLKGFTEALEKDKDAKSRVRIGFELTNTGMLRLHSAQGNLEQVVLVPIPVEKKPMNTTTPAGDKKEGEESTEEKTEETPAPEEEVKYKEEKKITKVNIDYDVTSFTLAPLSDEELKVMRTRMEHFENIENARQNIAQARNELEGRVYATQNMLDDEDYEQYYTEDEASKLRTLLTAADDWLAETDEDPSITAEDYKGKLQEIDTLARPIRDRRDEVSKRADNVDTCKSVFKLTRNVVAEMEKNSPHITEEERQNLLNTVSETEQWLDEQLEKQSGAPLNQAPVVTSAEIRAQCAKIQPMTTILMNKPKPVEEKVEGNKTEDKTNEKKDAEQEAPKDDTEQETPKDDKKDEL